MGWTNEQVDGLSDWRVLGSQLHAWFDAESAGAGAELVRRLDELRAAPPYIDLRTDGLRVRLDRSDVATAASVSATARELGLVADPTPLQSLSVVIESPAPDDLLDFWEAALGYRHHGRVLADPAGRDPNFSLAQVAAPRPLRNRIHIDSVRPAEAVEAAEATVGPGQEPYGVRRADADGNEVDLLPGGGLTDLDSTTDWRSIFAAMVHYPVPSPVTAAELVTAVAGLVDRAGVPLLVDVGPQGVTIDSGKDQFEDDEGSVPQRCAELAAEVQSAARDLGFSATTAPLRFVQVGIDAVDIAAVRTFWAAALGYREDPRGGVTDLYDPRRLNPVVFFQNLDREDTERRAQRNRVRIELVVPSDEVRGRVQTALDAGGSLRTAETGRTAGTARTEEARRWSINDPEGNELDLIVVP